MKPDYLTQIGIGMGEQRLSRVANESAAILFGAIDSHGPDLVILGAGVGKLGVFDSPPILQMLRQLRCPVIVAKDFGIPGVRKAESLFRKAVGR